MPTLAERDHVLQEHRVTEHRHSPMVDYFKEIIYGGIDGIITTFAVVAGFSGAALSNDATTQLSFLVVLLFGLANLFADATSMGLGNFLSVRSEKDVYNAARAKESHEMTHNTEMEYQETISILMSKGYNETDATALADLYQKNHEYWLDFMMTHELEMSDPRGDNPVLTGLTTFSSFLVFGSIPLIPFIIPVAMSAATAFELSVVGTFTALVLLALLKWRVVGTSLGKTLFEVLVVGVVAAAVAFFVGTWFEV